MSTRVTSVEVARLAGVSQSAVSRTFTKGGRVAEKTRERVLEAAQMLGYQPNALARSLITQRSNMIGVIMGEFNNPFYPELIKSLNERLRIEGFRLMLFTIPDGSDADAVLPELLEYQVDGVIITSATLSSGAAEECRRFQTPVILFNRYTDNANDCAVCCDNRLGGESALYALSQAGRKKLGMIAGPDSTSTSRDRESGFFAAAHGLSLAEPRLERGGFSYQGGYDAACRLLEDKEPLDGVFCANDIMALGAMDALRDVMHLRIPEDIAVIGFDDIEATSWPSYKLTTVRQPVTEMIEATLAMLCDYMELPTRMPEQRHLPGTVIYRNSCPNLTKAIA